MTVLAIVFGLTLGPSCPDRPDANEAAALWRQTRSALRAAAAPAAAGRATLLRFERSIARDGQTVTAQHVQHDSARAGEPIQSVHAGLDVARDGFVRDSDAGTRTYVLPDASILLDERFRAGYCVSLAAPDVARPSLAGLRFVPRLREAARVDVDATLWIDTSTAVPRRIDFRYLGLHPSLEAYRPGGSLLFRRFENGQVLVERWTLRTAGGGSAREAGAQLASVQWDAGGEWRASLGAARVRAVDARGRPRGRTPVQLAGSSYGGTTNSGGWLELRDLLPGPYDAVVEHAEFTALGLPPIARAGFVAARDSVASVALVVRTPEEFVEHACQEVGLYTAGSYLVIGRIVEANGRPALGAAWEINDLRRRATRIMPRGMADPATARGVTGSDGLFVYCRALDWGSVVEVRVWRNRSLLRGEPATVALRTLNKRVTGVRLELPPEP